MSFFASFSFAQCPGSPPAGIDCVVTAGSKDITAHSECRSITNNHVSGKALMVPTNTSTEWSTFYGATIAGVTISACAADPCASKSIGQAGDSTTALCAGTFDGGKYMIMPSGCADDTSDPTCSGGTDTVTKYWRGSTGSNVDILTIANIGGAATPSTERGHYTTVEIVNDASISANSAADFCNDMDYGGFTDWYLPSKSELAYIYCKSSPASHNVSYPQENANCGGSGPSNELTGFAAGYYWASTERNTGNVWSLRFDDGYQDYLGKNYSRSVRCVRRY